MCSLFPHFIGICNKIITKIKKQEKRINLISINDENNNYSNDVKRSIDIQWNKYYKM